ncbi:MAG: T9SS type A sorting domain-containing protein [Bacteroidales bacterium]
MIKKILFTAAFVISVVIMLNAQPCTPGTYTTPGIYPDSATNLPHAIATVAYSTTMTAVIPQDTLYMGATVPIDSIGVTSIVGLPTGFNYTPNSATGYWDGGTSGCVLISSSLGYPTQQQVGIYPLKIYVKSCVTILGNPLYVQDSVLYYKIIIDSSNAGITDMNKGKFNVYQNTPNPFSLKTTIEFTSPIAEIFQFTVYNLLGEVVYKQSVNAISGDNKIEFSASDLTSGIYMYKLNNKTQTITRRMIIEGM